MIGVEPEMLAPRHFFEATHPDNLYRHILGRVKMLKTAHELYIAEKGAKLLSSCFIMRNHENKYRHLLFQGYLFYTEIPYKTVYLSEVHTEIESLIRIKNGFHYYYGNDISCFRYPDELLLNTGLNFSDLELEVIKLLNKGMTTEQIAEKLFISMLIVNTHRSNTLHKSGKASTAELVRALTELGVL